MGASFSTRLSDSNVELRKRVDAAATTVVLDSSFTDLMKLSNEKHCNRLVKKTADIFQKNENTIDLELLRKKLYDQKQKERDGENTDNDAPEKHKKIKKTPRIHNVEKKCIQISKFYVLFAHLFSCIVSTINPAFKIESSDKKEKTITTSKSDSSEEVDFCSGRISGLINKSEQNSDGEFLVNPDVCETNLSKSGKALRLIDLPGMKALQQMYKDIDAGANDNSEENDARILYSKFVGDPPPPDIRRFDQIPLKVYINDKECEKQRGGASEETQIKEQRRDKERRDFEKKQEEEQEQEQIQDRERMFYFQKDRDRKKNEEENSRTGVYSKGVVGSLKERLFSEYVQNVKEMIERAEYNRSKLLEILSEMFTYTYNSDGSIGGVIINPSLTYKKLQGLVVQTRRIVIKLYTDCEEDYKNGLDIFFAIVQEKIALKLSVQEEVLKKQLEDVMYGPLERYIPESLLYQQQFPGAEEFNKKQFIPPHFKSSVVSIIKKQVSDNDFRQFLPTLNEWINEEIENATSLLDPRQVASEFLKENVYGDDDGSSSTTSPIIDVDDVSFSPSATTTPSSSAPPSSAPPYSAPPYSAPSAPIPSSIAATPMSKMKTVPTSSRASALKSGSPSPKKVASSSRVAGVNPTKLSFFDAQ
jgi:hypothetical protein